MVFFCPQMVTRRPPRRHSTSNWASTFDLVTSHSALHFAKDLLVTLENAKMALKSGGKFMLMFAVEDVEHFLVACRRAALKWSAYVPQDVMDTFTPITRQLKGDDGDDDPTENFREMIDSVGLKLRWCQLERELYAFQDSTELREVLEPLCPHLRFVPPEMKRALIDDLLEEYERACPWVDEEGVEKPTWDCRFLIVHGEKIFQSRRFYAG